MLNLKVWLNLFIYFKLVTKDGGEVTQQVEPHFGYDQLGADASHQIAFIANSKSVSIESYGNLIIFMMLDLYHDQFYNLYLSSQYWTILTI